MNTISEKRIRIRMVVVGVCFVLAMGVIVAKALYVQAIDNGWLAERASKQYVRSFKSSGKRGTITDAQDRVLAVSIEVVSIAAYPGRIEDASAAAAALAPILRIDQAALTKELKTTSRAFVWVKRKVTPKEAEAVRALKLEGIDFIPERKRYYPNRTLAAQVIGFTGIDGEGLEGLEYQFNDLLRGETGSFMTLRDALGRNFEMSKQRRTSLDGSSLQLTIDTTIQYIVEKELTAAVTDNEAISGKAVVLQVGTGAVLAMANVPTFNPNSYGSFPNARWRNRVLADRFEPGSTMKIFSAAAAIESGGYTPSSAFYCEEGEYRIGQNVVHDTTPHGWLTLGEIVKYSSNIGAVKLGESIGAHSLHDTLQRFGFGVKSGIRFPGETGGTLRSFEKWAKIDAGAISFGQGIAVNAVQLAAATAAIANNGILMKPYLIKEIRDSRGRAIQSFSPQVIRRVVSADTAHIVSKMMRSVVSEGGTGRNAAIEGYSVCGKTGTAQKVDDSGHYADDAFIASFVGFLPATKPEVVILVVIDSPKKSHYGGTVAAPAFRRMAIPIMNHMNIPPDQDVNHLVATDHDEVKG